MTTAVGFHAVILAGGKGLRFQASLPKQFCLVNGAAIIFHTVEKFVREKMIKNIIVVAPEDRCYQNKMEEVLKPLAAYDKLIKVTTGGKSRHRSVVQGLECLRDLLMENGKNWDEEIVVIHDGVRPFVTSADISGVTIAAKEHKSAGIAVMIRGSTVELTEDCQLVRCCDRATHWSSEAPQAFQMGFIYKCYKQCSEHDLDYLTDCVQIALKYGNSSAKFIKGDPQNMKITYPPDLYTASRMLSEVQNILLILPEFSNDAKLEISNNSTQTCCLTQVADYSIENVSTILYVLREVSCHLQQEADNILRVLESTNDNRLRKLRVIIFVTSEKNFGQNSDSFRGIFLDICKQFTERNLVSHVVVTEDYSPAIERIKGALHLLSDTSLLPSGQILHF